MSIIFLISTVLLVIVILWVKPALKGTMAIMAILVNSLLSSWVAVRALGGNDFNEILYGGAVFGDIPLRLDSLSAWFVLLTNFTLITGILYGKQYLAHYQSRPADLGLHYSSYLLNHAALTGVYFIQNSLAFLCTWEIMALTSFILIIFEHGKIKTLKAGINYLIQSHISIILLTLGFIWVYSKTGSLHFDAIIDYCVNAGKEASLLLFLVFFFGFGIKAGFVPFHTWLPHAHPAAPSHFSGIMSGVIIKSGIYGILRILVLMPDNKLAIGYIILAVSVITGVYGVMLAIIQHNLKRLLAYHSIENIGIIGMGIGIGAIGSGLNNPVMTFAGYAGALLHTLNHSLFKSLLFYTAGNVYHAVHTLTIDRMGGLFRYMPRTALLFLLAALAICGLPPFNGFISEFIIYSGLFNAIGNHQSALLAIMAVVGLALIGGLALLCFTKAFGIVFLGTERHAHSIVPHEAENAALLPKYLIAAVIILIGLFPQYFIKVLQQPVHLFAALPDIADHYGMIRIMQNISLSAWGLILLIFALYMVRKLVMRHKSVIEGPTWGCGYVTNSPKLQYTASSFVSPYMNIIKPLVEIKKTHENIAAIVPEPIHSETHFYDKLEKGLVDWPTRNLRGFLGRFKFLQNGSVQFYALYGVVFIGISITIPWIIDALRSLFHILNQL
jgi:formate hydrogenlyase subunit 3/multisubunit Na+/H+ antiporter MnhD subunit